MTQAAAVPTKALEALKRYVKSIPYASNDNPVCELRNIQTLMKAERHIEALERLTRLFDSRLLPESGQVSATIDEVEELRGDLDGAEDEINDLSGQVGSLEKQVSRLEEAVERLTTEREEGRNRIDQLESEISALQSQIPGFSGKA